MRSSKIFIMKLAISIFFFLYILLAILPFGENENSSNDTVVKNTNTHSQPDQKEDLNTSNHSHVHKKQDFAATIFQVEETRTDKDMEDTDIADTEEEDDLTTEESTPPQTAQGEMAHGIGGSNPLDKEFFSFYTNGYGGYWHRIRIINGLSDQVGKSKVTNLCIKAHRGSPSYSADKNMKYFYQWKPKFQEYKVKLNMEDIGSLVTDLVECNVDIIISDINGNIHEQNKYVFYLAEGNRDTNLFMLERLKPETGDKETEKTNRIEETEEPTTSEETDEDVEVVIRSKINNVAY